MTEGSGKGGERDRVSPLVDAVGIHADAAVASTSGETISGVEIPTMSAELLEAEAEALRARLRATSEDLTSLANLSKSALSEVLGMRGGVESTAEHLLSVFAGLESLDAMEGSAERAAGDLASRLEKARLDLGSGATTEINDTSDADLDNAIKDAEQRLAATRKTRDEVVVARRAMELEESSDVGKTE
jgi:hypothetical protein|tara:strand:+ start:14353 stop:14916 length:564 start_codon:yes stop_codon:yes gene_type:complete